VFWYHMHM